MTTREIYFKGLYFSEKSVGLMRYFYEDENKIIHLDGFIAVHYNRDEVISARNINRMMEEEKKDGFKCWAISPEGEKFLNDNWEVLGKDQIENLYKYE